MPSFHPLTKSTTRTSVASPSSPPKASTFGAPLQQSTSRKETTAPTHPVAIITGAGQGIGRAIACRLARDGYSVALSDIVSNKDALAETAKLVFEQTSKNALMITGDVSKEEEVKGLVNQVVKELGGLDVMVANAGMAILQPFVESTAEVWQKTYDVNVKGVVFCYKYAALAMIKQGRGGRIIGACSIAGKRGDPNSAAYCASKFAVRGLSQTVALELAPYGINVNCYAPGAIHTAFLDKVDEIYTREEKTERGTYIKKRVNGIPLGRVGTPEDVAGLVSFLSGPDSQFMTGQAVTIDGGVLFD